MKRQFMGDLRNEAHKEALLALLKPDGQMLNICFLDEELGDYEIRVDGNKIGLGRVAKRVLTRFFREEGMSFDPSQN